jgi:hypothetical protein
VPLIVVRSMPLDVEWLLHFQKVVIIKNPINIKGLRQFQICRFKNPHCILTTCATWRSTPLMEAYLMVNQPPTHLEDASHLLVYSWRWLHNQLHYFIIVDLSHGVSYMRALLYCFPWIFYCFFLEKNWISTTHCYF